MRVSWLLLWLDAGATEAVEEAACRCTGQQPQLIHAEGRQRLVFFGESRMMRADHPVKVLVSGYPRRGDTAADHCAFAKNALAPDPFFSSLSGNWACLAFRPEGGTLEAACDWLGAEAVYWRRLPQGWAFASRASWLAALPPAAPDDLDAWRDFLLWGLRDRGARTFWQGVRGLCGGQCLTFSLDATAPERRRWYVPPEVREGPPFPRARAREAAVELRQRLGRAVRRGLAGADTALAFLSGGLDSSSLAALGRPAVQGALATHWPGQPFDEFRFAQTAAGHLGLELHAVRPSDRQFLDAIESLLALHEGPVMSPGAFAQYALMQQAGYRGAAVVLDGTGADSLLAGHTVHLWLHGWRSLWRGRLAEWQAVLGRAGGARAFFSAFAKWAAKDWLYRNAHSTLAGFILRKQYEEWALFDPEFVRGSTLPDGRPVAFSTLNEVLHTEYFGGEVRFLLRSLHRNADAFGLRVHAPFAHEPRLAEWLMALPAALKVHAGWTKWILRQAMADVLPESITWRVDKQAQATPANRWARLLIEAYWPALEADPLGIFRKGALRRLRVGFFRPQGPVERYRVFKFAAAAVWWHMQRKQ